MEKGGRKMNTIYYKVNKNLELELHYEKGMVEKIFVGKTEIPTDIFDEEFLNKLDQYVEENT